VITTEETGTKPQERDVVSAFLEKNGKMLLGCSGRTTLRREQCDVVWKAELKYPLPCNLQIKKWQFQWDSLTCIIWGCHSRWSICEWQNRTCISVASGLPCGTLRLLNLISAVFRDTGRLLMAWKLVILIINEYFLF
jgi:hypothetical protein